MRVEVRDPDYTPELQGRLGKLEAAISKQRTVRFRYWSIARDDERERTINPYALLPENGTWYVIGLDLEDRVVKNFRVSRIRSEIRFATRRERDFRIPESFDVEEFRGRAEWQFGDAVGEARIERRAGHRLVGPARVRAAAQPCRGRPSSSPQYASLPLLARWILRQDGPGGPARALARSGGSSPRGCGPPAAPTRASCRCSPRRSACPGPTPPPSRQAGPVAPERFGVLQSLLAYLLAACGDDRDAVISARAS